MVVYLWPSLLTWSCLGFAFTVTATGNAPLRQSLEPFGFSEFSRVFTLAPSVRRESAVLVLDWLVSLRGVALAFVVGMRVPGTERTILRLTKPHRTERHDSTLTKLNVWRGLKSFK